MVLRIVCPAAEAADARILLAGLSAELVSFSVLCMFQPRCKAVLKHVIPACLTSRALHS